MYYYAGHVELVVFNKLMFVEMLPQELMLVEEKLVQKCVKLLNFCVSPNALFLFVICGDVLTFKAFIAVTLLKADICTRDHTTCM